MPTANAMRCPGCSFDRDEASESCARCGLIFAKAHPRPPEVAPRLPERPEPPDPAIEVWVDEAAEPPGRPWKFLAGGLVAAALAHAIGVISFVLSPLVTLLHEFGHAACAWLLGCPAIPAFDFVYGGGVTHHKNFQLPLAMLVGAGFAWAGWTFRRNPRTLALLTALAAVWLIAVSADWRREVVIAAMGHGGEAILAAAFLYMALTGKGWRHPEFERPLGAFAGWFVLLQTLGFAWRLRTDPEFLAWYRGGKGGALMNDLEVVALDLKIWTGIETDISGVAAWLLGLALVPAAAAILAYVFRHPVERLARTLLVVDPR